CHLSAHTGPCVAIGGTPTKKIRGIPTKKTGEMGTMYHAESWCVCAYLGASFGTNSRRRVLHQYGAAAPQHARCAAAAAASGRGAGDGVRAGHRLSAPLPGKNGGRPLLPAVYSGHRPAGLRN